MTIQEMIYLIVKTSYFYQVRFFKKHMLPISTALYDPKWFHNFGSQTFIFRDKNGILNGLRMLELVPGSACSNICAGQYICGGSPGNCDFFKNYRKQLDSINFRDFIEKLEKVAMVYKAKADFDEEPILVFLVHEAPNNQCSERVIIQDWFKANGLDVTELEYPIGAHY